MIKNRKGMSDVVTTVLVILLVVIAVGIIWVFVQKPIQQAGTQIGKATACTSSSLELLSCKKDGPDTDTDGTGPDTDTDINDIVATVKVSQGSFAEVRFIVDQAAGTTIVYGDTTGEVTGDVPTTSGTGNLQIVGGAATGASNPIKISAIPVVTTNDGTKATCTETLKVTCS